jgi:hypothetical protein
LLDRVRHGVCKESDLIDGGTKPQAIEGHQKHIIYIEMVCKGKGHRDGPQNGINGRVNYYVDKL